MAEKKALVVGVMAVLAAVACGGWLLERGHAPKAVLTLYGNVDIRQVDLGFRVAGRLAALTVDEGSTVREGDVLGRLDDEPYRRALAGSEAALESARARYALLKAGSRAEDIAQAAAQVDQAQASLVLAQSNYERAAKLRDGGATSERQYDQSLGQRDADAAALRSARDALARARNGNRVQDIQQARAEADRAEAAVAQARLSVEDCVLRAPSGGVVMTRAVEPGAMLGAGATALTVSLTRPVWVRAYVDEPSLGRVQPGEAVALFADTLPEHSFHGHVGYISPTAEFTPKSVETPNLRTDLVYRLRIVVDDADESLRQGMPVTVKIDTGRADATAGPGGVQAPG